MKNENRLQRELEDILSRYQAAGYFPSAAVRVFNARETLASAAIGEAKEDSVFDVASLTKIATSAQVLLAVSRGEISLRGKIMDYLPEIAADPFLRSRMDSVDLYRLLTHTSSLPAWYPFYTCRGQDFFQVLRTALQGTEPAKGVVYSDLNFMLLGKLLERIRRKPLELCLQEDLVQPLSLGRMAYLPDPAWPVIPSSFGNPIEEEMCRERGLSFDAFRPADRLVRGQVNDGNSWYYFSGIAGHAGIFATAEAYENLCRFFMTSADPLLQEAQREQPSAPGRGLGFQTGISYPHGCGHTGFTGTGIYFSRTADIGVVSFTNRLFYPQSNKNETWEFRRALQEAAFALCGQFAVIQ